MTSNFYCNILNSCAKNIENIERYFFQDLIALEQQRDYQIENIMTSQKSVSRARLQLAKLSLRFRYIFISKQGQVSALKVTYISKAFGAQRSLIVAQ